MSLFSKNSEEQDEDSLFMRKANRITAGNPFAPKHGKGLGFGKKDFKSLGGSIAANEDKKKQEEQK